MAFNKKLVLQQNIKAIDLAFRSKNGEKLNTEEIEDLKRYAGFGGIKEVLLNPDFPNNWTKTDLKVFEDIKQLHQVIKFNTESEKEYDKFMREINANTLSAFFTPQNLCDSIVKVFKGAGFVPNSVLEPSAGSGKFIEALSKEFILGNVVSIEKDSLTSMILSGIYQDKTQIINSGFEQAKLNNKYDLVISNIPFGNFSVFDKGYALNKGSIENLSTQRIHNYFFVKGLEQTKNNGYLAYITTSSFSDSAANEIFRKHLVNNADLEAFVRLPNNLFALEAGTEVGTDLIILKKNEFKTVLSPTEKAFVQTSKLLDISINGLLIDANGELDKSRILASNTYIDTNMYGKTGFIHELTLNELLAIDSLLSNQIKLSPYKSQELKKPVLPQPIKYAKAQPLQGQLSMFDMLFEEEFSKKKEAKISKEKLPRETKKGNLIIHENKIFKVGELEESTKEFSLIEYKIDTKQQEKLNHYCKLRDTFNRLYLLESEIQKPIANLRNDLNSLYDEFTKTYGLLHDKSNIIDLKDDEQFEQTKSFLERRTYKDQKYSFEKGAIFENPINIDSKLGQLSSEEAIAFCLNKNGRVIFNELKELTGLDTDELQEKAKGQIFYNPLAKLWETADQFLSGDVVEKKIFFENNYSSQEINNPSTLLGNTYHALLKVQPEKIPFELLDINMGERWINKSLYSDFACKLFKQHGINVNYSSSLDEYSVINTNSYSNPIITKEFAVRSESRLFTGINLFEHALQNTSPNITMKIGHGADERSVPDYRATREASQKIDSIRNEFTNYLKSLPEEQKISISDKYNRLYNSTVKRNYNGTHLRLEDIQGVNPYKHQKDAVWMIMQNNGGIIDHPVGAGKTIVMCIAAHEMKRLKIAKKPAILGLKANIIQIADEYRRIFPNDKVLFPTKADLQNDNRVEFFQQMQNQDWDCIIMTHEQFQKIPQSPEIERQIIEEEIKNIEDNLYEIRNQGGDISKAMLKGLEVRKLNKESQLNNLLTSLKKDARLVNFETIGIDHMLIDESHKFKNLEFTTRHDRVAGLGNPRGSLRALNMLTALRTVQQKNGKDLGVTFLSGTTISNSLTEMYLLFKYLRPEALEKQQISNFDSWVAVYGKKSTEFEFNVTNELKMKERFRTFIKVPELSAFYNDITDFKTFEDLKLDKPEMEVELVVCKQTPDQQAFIKNLIEFAKTGDGDHIGRGKLSETEKNAVMLIATNYAKKMALDMRLVSRSYDDHPENKISVCCNNIGKMYQESNQYLGTQAVFCDTGTPGTDGFNIYEAIKYKLVDEHGIKPEEIVFVHSAVSDNARIKLFKKVNEGVIRVILGSTEKLGTGVNIQSRIVAMHDLDIPWRPSDLEQRHGRGARAGNWVAKNHFANRVKTYVYATENTLDVYKFNLLKNKQLFIDQIKSNKINVRTVDEGGMDESTGMSFSEYVAVLSGNTDLLDKAKLENKINTLESEKQLFFRDKKVAENAINQGEVDIERISKLVEILKVDQEKFHNALQFDKNGTKLNPVILNGKTYKEAEDLGNAILKIYKENKSPKMTEIGELYGFKLAIEYNEMNKVNRLFVLSSVKDANLKYTSNNGEPSLENPSFSSRFFLSSISKVEKLVTDNESKLNQIKTELELYKEMSLKVWPDEKEAKLKELKKEHLDLVERIETTILLDQQKEIKEENSVVEEPKQKYGISI